MTAPHLSATQGLSLAESILAIFLLAGGAFVCLTLVASTANFSGQTQRFLEATQLAERTVEAIRGWAYQPDNYFSDWALYNDDLQAFADFPDYGVRSECAAPQAIYSLSSSLEREHLHQARVMEEAYVPVRVTVTWGTRSLQCSFHAGLAERPVRAADPVSVVRVAGPADPIPFRGQVDWAAELYGDDGQPIPGAAIQWQIVPYDSGGHIVGAALVEPDRGRLGRQARLYHQFYTGDPILGLGPYPVPGWIRLRAEACYLGRSYIGESEPIELGP